MTRFMSKYADKIKAILGRRDPDNLEGRIVDDKINYGDVIIRNEKGEILLLQRSYQDDFEPGKWCLPGGKIEQGETPIEGTRRELKEETGLDVNQLNILDRIIREDSVSHYFCTYTHSNTPIILDNEESYRYHWCSLEKLIEVDLILDLKDILINKLHLPLFDIHMFNIEVDNMEELKNRLNDFEFALNNNKIDQKDFNKCLDISKQKALDIVKKGFNQGLVSSQTYLRYLNNVKQNTNDAK